MNTFQGVLFVVDDDHKSRKAVAALASSMKIGCELFASAEEFLDRYDASLTGCVLADFRLGGMDGLQLLDRLKSLGSALSVILISAYADVPLAVRAMNGGSMAVIEKPYKNDDLAHAVRKAIDYSTRVKQSFTEQTDGCPQHRLIAYDLHDGVIQYLTASLMCLEQSEQYPGIQTDEARVAFKNAIRLIRRSIDELRTLIRGVHVVTSGESIVDALQELVSDFHHHRLQIELLHDAELSQLGTWLSSAVYRMVQESLTNVRRHSRSPRARIEVRQRDGHVCVDVRDWGIGFDVDKVQPERLGLQGIRERARLFGGEATIKSATSKGTCVSIRIPIDQSAIPKTFAHLVSDSAANPKRGP